MADLNWAFTLSDEMTKPLEHIEKALEALPKDIATVDKALVTLERHAEMQRLAKMTDTMKAQQAMLRLRRKGLLEVDGATKHAEKSTKALGSTMAETAGSVALGNLMATAAQKALDFGMGVLRGAKSLAAFALEAQQGKRAAVAMIATFEGADAGRVEEILGEMAKAAGVTGDKTAQMFVKLRGAGVKAQEAQNIIAAALDVRAMQGGGERGMASAEKFVDMIGKIGVLAKSSPKDLKMLALDVGISPQQIAEQMAARTGGTAKAALALLESGKADAMAVQTAVLDVIQQRGGGGPLGALAKTFQAGDVSGQITSLEEEFSGLVNDIDFSPLARGLAEVRKFFAGDAGARIKDTLSGIGPLLTVAGEKAMIVFDAFSRAFDGAMLKDMTGVLGKFVGMLGLLDTKTLESIGQAFAVIAKVLGAATFVAVSFFAVMTKSILKTVETINAVFQVIASMPEKMVELGKGIVDGLIGGVNTGIEKLGEAAGKVAGTFIGAIKDKFQIRSPSRVMMGLGEQIGDGFAMGIDSSMPDVGGALPTLTAGAGASLGGGVVINLGGITVNGTSEAASREAASRVESDIRGALMSALEGFALA